jgi:hypothetical protein
MIPADIDPSLSSGEPRLESLEDGFSPPHHEEAEGVPPTAEVPEPEALLTTKSPF